MQHKTMLKQQLYTINNNNKENLDFEILKAETSSERRSGLIKYSLDQRQGLLIPGGFVIHMIGMNYPLHLVFISRSKVIKKIVAAKPGFKFYFSKNWYCLEIPADSDINFLDIGQQLDWN
jgi:uncharacterized membrane protein (UPF0127 family)